MFKLSCADFTFPLMDRLAALKLIRLLDLDFVDIGLFARSTHFSPSELRASPRVYTEKVRQDLDAAGVHASDVFLQIGIDPAEFAANDPDPSVRSANREVFLVSLEFCAALGCKHITGLPGVFHHGVAPEQDLGHAAEVAAWRHTECAKAGVEYAVEPHVGSLCASVEGTMAFLTRTPGLTLTLDYGHFIMAGEKSPRVDSLLPWASHVHVRGGALDRLQTSVEENAIDFAGMLEGLKHHGYRGFLALEYVWIDWNQCNRTDNVSETVRLRRLLESSYAAMVQEPSAVAD